MRRDGDLKNIRLGNFGFLLDYEGQDFLYELGQQAESYLYINKRISAVFVRQLTEAFFDTVIRDFSIQVMSFHDGKLAVTDMPEVKDKQLAIAGYFKKAPDPYYRENVFPVFPGAIGDKKVRISCPEGEGDGSDPERKTLYVWDFIRKLGNVGSHGVLTENNLKWLQEKYILTALKELCNRMSHYFYRRHPRNGLYVYDPGKSCYGSRQTFFALEKQAYQRETGILPGFREQKCIAVVPEPVPGKKNFFDNHRGKYAIVRAYTRTKNEDLKNFLLQSQRANLIIQEHGGITGIPEYTVLADLRFEQDYYVVSYLFNTNPMELNYMNLLECGVYDDFQHLIRLFLKILTPVSGMCGMHIYHRTFTHHSVLLEKGRNNEFFADIIDLETCKIFEEDALTILSFANAEISDGNDGPYRPGKGNLKQYNRSAWSADTSEKEYDRIVRERVSDVCMNILCPYHLEEYYEDDYPATAEEVLDGGNSYLWDNPAGNDRDAVKRVMDLFDDLRSGEKSWADMIDGLVKISRENETKCAIE